jgi:hypothetical protein
MLKVKCSRFLQALAGFGTLAGFGVLSGGEGCLFDSVGGWENCAKRSVVFLDFL